MLNIYDSEEKQQANKQTTNKQTKNKSKTLSGIKISSMS